MSTIEHTIDATKAALREEGYDVNQDGPATLRVGNSKFRFYEDSASVIEVAFHGTGIYRTRNIGVRDPISAADYILDRFAVFI